MEKLNIYGTIGPSCFKKETIQKMFELGMTGMRLNLSHIDLVDSEVWINNFFDGAKGAGVKPELLIDMKGPELRIEKFREPILLKEHDVVELSLLHLPAVVLPYCIKGQAFLIDDGKLCLKMVNNHMAYVERGGLLKSGKSIALIDKEVHLPALTENDHKNLKVASKYGITGIMQPFVRSAQDLKCVRETMNRYGLQNCKLYAKIENQSGIDNLEELIKECDEIIIARGDLGNALSLPKLPSAQKYIENVCKEHNKAYMVVTEMLNSMIANPVCTRAEVSDIYHAVYHGASSIMLTGETAAGKYPVEAMECFVLTAKEALKDR